MCEGHVWLQTIYYKVQLCLFKNADGQKLLAYHSSFCWVIFKRLHDLLEVFKLLFFLLFYHEKYSIKDICVYSKSKIKTKVTSKQILEHFKMMNQRLFIHKLCNNSEMLLSSSWAIFIRVLVFLSSPAFLHLSTCVFCFY